MTYFYLLYAVALSAAISLIFWARIRDLFRVSRDVLDSPQNTAPLKSLKTRRMSVALNKWMVESAVEVPLEEPPQTLPPAPDEPQPQAPVGELSEPIVEPSVEPIVEPSEAASTCASEDAGPKEAEQPAYSWQDTYSAHNGAETNYYETLQISPHADTETIHRVYRILASRFHPDNPRTGNVERFYQLSKAFEVLSNSAKRMAYDATYSAIEQEPARIFRVEDFVDGVKGEENRRLGVLSLLYNRRRVMEDSPGLSLLELERRMAVPREYLHFTIWYLRSKEYIRTQESNSDLALTADGVDYVEKHCSTNHVIRELLTSGQEDHSSQVEESREAQKAAA